MRKVFLPLIAVTVMLIYLPGCGGSGGSGTGGIPPEELIVGKWQFSTEAGGTGMTEIYEFNSDGSVINNVIVTGGMVGTNEPPNTGTYTISDNELSITNDFGQTLTYTFEFLDQNRLDLSIYSGRRTIFQRVEE
jgi:hypothetical protein